MKNIWLQAYSHGNFGDDLFIKIISERYPDATFYLYAEHSSIYVEKLPNIKVLKPGIWLKILSKIRKTYLPYKSLIKKCDIGVWLGGSMFIERSNWKNSFLYYQEIVNVIPEFCLIGSNFGPYQSQTYKDAYGSLFHKLKDCCFRDNFSAALFQEDHVRSAPDLVFSTKVNAVAKEKNKIVVSVVDLRHKSELVSFYESYKNTLRTLVKELVAQGFDVTIAAFCTEQGDLKCAKEIAATEDCKILEYTNNLEEVLQEIATAEYVIATRFHAMILGWLMGCKVYPVIYDQKMENVLDDVHWNYGSCKVDKMNRLSSEEILKNSGRLKEVNRISKEAEKQFAYLDHVLKGDAFDAR